MRISAYSSLGFLGPWRGVRLVGLSRPSDHALPGPEAAAVFMASHVDALRVAGVYWRSVLALRGGRTMKQPIRTILVVGVFALALFGGAMAGPFEDGKAAYQSGDYETALRLWRPLADQGNAEAQAGLGWMYFHGQGVAQDYAQAVFWYREAADQGHVAAQANLGLMHEHGQGVAQDYAQAAAWYRKAADQGNADAQYDLGVAYEHGQGVPKDDAQAAAWLRKAADQGDAFAQENLGSMYATGHGVTQDYAQAHMWFSLSASRAPYAALRDLAVEGRDEVAVKMKPAQRAEAQRMAREWKPK